MKTRILICIGTRADAVKMAPLCRVFRESTEFETIIMTSGQHREMCDRVLRYFSVEPDCDLCVMEHGSDPDSVVERVRKGAKQVISELSPDIVAVHGDTSTALGCTLAASEMCVRIAHIEAGLRSGDLSSPYPEEGYRRRISKLAYYHFAPTEAAEKNLLSEGISGERVWVCGNTVIDALRLAMENMSIDRDGLYGAGGYVLLTCHRRENRGAPSGRIFGAVGRLLEGHSGVRVLFPIHKSGAVRADFAASGLENDRLTVCEPLDYPDFVRALCECRFVISDSGGVCEEASYLGVPTLYVREKTERAEAAESGPVIMCGSDEEKILSYASRLLDDDDFYRNIRSRRYEYGDGGVSRRIAGLLSEQFLTERL